MNLYEPHLCEICKDQVRTITHEPTDWQRLAVLQTERAWVASELDRKGNTDRTGTTPIVTRYNAIDDAIRKALGALND